MFGNLNKVAEYFRIFLLNVLFPDIKYQLMNLSSSYLRLQMEVMKKEKYIRKLLVENENLKASISTLKDEKHTLEEANSDLIRENEILEEQLRNKRTLFDKIPPKTLKPNKKSTMPYGTGKPFRVVTSLENRIYTYRLGTDPIIVGTYLDPLIDGVKGTPKQIFDEILGRVQESYSYESDQRQWNAIENWTPSNIVFYTKKDDCESLAQLVVSAFYWYELRNGPINNWMVAMVYGTWDGIGHGWPMLFGDNEIYLGEATYWDRVPSKPWEQLKDHYRPYSWSVITYPHKDSPNGVWDFEKD